MIGLLAGFWTSRVTVGAVTVGGRSRRGVRSRVESGRPQLDLKVDLYRATFDFRPEPHVCAVVRPEVTSNMAVAPPFDPSLHPARRPALRMNFRPSPQDELRWKYCSRWS